MASESGLSSSRNSLRLVVPPILSAWLLVNQHGIKPVCVNKSLQCLKALSHKVNIFLGGCPKGFHKQHPKLQNIPKTTGYPPQLESKALALKTSLTYNNEYG